MRWTPHLPSGVSANRERFARVSNELRVDPLPLWESGWWRRSYRPVAGSSTMRLARCVAADVLHPRELRYAEIDRRRCSAREIDRTGSMTADPWACTGSAVTRHAARWRRAKRACALRDAEIDGVVRGERERAGHDSVQAGRGSRSIASLSTPARIRCRARDGRGPVVGDHLHDKIGLDRILRPQMAPVRLIVSMVTRLRGFL